MATLKEYLVLSQIAYNDFDIRSKSELGNTIGNILVNSKSSLSDYLRNEGNKIWRKHLQTIHDWILINCRPNMKSGFAGAAFRSPAGEAVIAFRGTEPPSIRDFGTDAFIYTCWDEKMIVQFSDAKQFVCQTLGINSLDKMSKNNMPRFTGHSLGGGLSDYLAYSTGSTSTTFNAVGFVQCLPNDELENTLKNLNSYKKRIKDYCDAWDIIGNSGIHIGERIFLINDQTLDAPYHVPTAYNATNSWDYLNKYLNNYFENLWNYAVYICEDNIDKAKDFFKKLYNSYIPVTGLLSGSPYSHGLKHFLNDIDADESLIKSNIAGSSEVAYCHDISKILQRLRINKREMMDTVNEAVKNINKKDAK